MSVNIRNPITGELTNASGGVINPKSINEMIAPIEDGTASKAYAVGEQFIMNDLLCEATQAIAQGDTMVIGTNCEESEQLSKQVKDINTSLTANGNRFEAGYSSANDEYGFNIGSTFYPIGASSGGVMVDTALDATSENPVQNKVITREINDINSDLSDFSFRVNSGVPEFSIDGGTTWSKLGGGTMKTMFGTVAPTSASATIDISSLNLSSADDYFVILNAGQVITGNSESQYGSFGHVTAKTNTSFTIGDISSSPGGIRPAITYQVVYNA